MILVLQVRNVIAQDHVIIPDPAHEGDGRKTRHGNAMALQLHEHSRDSSLPEIVRYFGDLAILGPEHVALPAITEMPPEYDAHVAPLNRPG